MPKFRKKPVVIEAFQMTNYRRWHNVDWPNWLHEAWNTESDQAGALYCKNGSASLFIHTLEGEHEVTPDDYIIQGVKGELYPCKPDIFEATYEPVEHRLVEAAKEALELAQQAGEEDWSVAR